MQSFLRTTTWARLLLVGLTLTVITVMIGPYQALEYALVPWDKAAHFIAAYAVTSLLFLGFPRRRRVDLAMITTFAGCAVEFVQLLTGRDAELGDIAANAIGAFAVVVPGYLEQARIAFRAAQDGQRIEVGRERRRSLLAKVGDPKPRAVRTGKTTAELA